MAIFNTSIMTMLLKIWYGYAQEMALPLRALKNLGYSKQAKFVLSAFRLLSKRYYCLRYQLNPLTLTCHLHAGNTVSSSTC